MSYRDSPPAFQFHKGTIKTFCYYSKVWLFSFQFHKGTIKTYKFKSGQKTILDFNSIKVRLKLSLKFKYKAKKARFQFHKGTIKTYLICISVIIPKSFQFHKGTIKTVNLIKSSHSTHISIP